MLLINKPTDLTSHDVVGRVRKIVGQKTVGHTGTLDPLATGLMVLVLGEATKLSDYLTAADKSYWLKIKLGVTTDSLDRTGAVLSETPCDALDVEGIRAAALALQGDFDWPVPLYSAAKIDGKRLCDYGREGKEVERPVKRMSFWDARVLELGKDRLEVTLSCSKGSFVRSWASELGTRLEVGGTVEELRRLSVGAWSIAQALTLEQLEERKRDLGTAFIPLGQALPDIKPIVVGPREIKLVMNGQIPKDVVTRLIFEQKQAIETNKPVFIKVLTAAGELLAILAAESGQGLKIRRVFRSFT